MSRCHETTVRTVEAIERTETPEDLWAVAASAAGGLGFRHVIALRSADGEHAPAVVFTNAPGLSYDDFADLMEHAASQPRPFSASEWPAESQTPQQAKRIESIKRTLAVDDVLFVPVRESDGAQGVVVFAGNNAAMPPVVRSSLHVLAHVVFGGGGCPLGSKGNKLAQLSRRESECLSLAAKGNTDVEIGRLLSISPRTTRFHIENAKKKLGVTTRTQAVAEALRLNAIAA